ncbi:MAG: hypothetical protein B6D38_03695 [Anaerolineae bacterium UTCFX1]|jgi:serine/threonine protein kinase|nr:MAG: hypothetical protein B6D38_03695 [Anaerolineae bacterium UTCFX1]
MTDLVGRTIGRYHILEQLGEGGMAVVYKALDMRLQRQVAIKVILPQRQFSPNSLKRFEREARALAQLSHPNIVKILDYGEQDNQPYLVMEYLSGGTLKQHMERQNGKALEWRAAAKLLIPIASALAAAHQQNIIHRDIKPSNILLTTDGHPMLSDFGIAKILDNEDTTDLTASGIGIGTPQYMAPEQGLGQVDTRSDIYALGTVYYEMVTGRLPYRADTPMAVMLKKTTEPLPRPQKFVPSLPDSVEGVLLTALSRNPSHRYQTMVDFRTALENPRAVKPQISRSKTKSTANRWGVGAAVGCVGFALLIIVILALFPQFAPRNNDNGISPSAISVSPLPFQDSAETAIPSLTPWPTTAQSDALQPTETPLPTEAADLPFTKERETTGFIIEYWDLVSNKDFSTAYQYLSTAFKARNHPNGIADFSAGFKYTASVHVLNAEVIAIDSSSATIDAELQFVTTDGTAFTTAHRYTLIRENGHWVIDSARKK